MKHLTQEQADRVRCAVYKTYKWHAENSEEYKQKVQDNEKLFSDPGFVSAYNAYLCRPEKALERVKCALGQLRGVREEDPTLVTLLASTEQKLLLLKTHYEQQMAALQAAYWERAVEIVLGPEFL